jgi:large subunit ribosomal protein L17
VRYERIRTTLAKAKEVQTHADRAVTWAKQGTHQYHVRANGYLRAPDLVTKLFSVIAPRYKDRAGGYTRILRAGYRRGDRAEMAVLEYVGRPGEMRVAKPGVPLPSRVVAEPPSLTERVAAVVARQRGVEGVERPSNLLPSFPRPSARPILPAQMAMWPGWAAKEAARQAAAVRSAAKKSAAAAQMQ